MKLRRVHYVLSTHWDREWYQTFQNYRYRLVQLMDRILEGWQDGRLQGPFQTDGQTIIIEDYLEVRPEKRAEIEALAKSGKLVMGPWYVMPDEFLVSGESLVRNLRMGRTMARQVGGRPSNAGFICDIFGHNSQMPQIFSGFGIQAGFLWRGTNQIEQRLFRWRSADGTELACYRFGHVGYCDYAFKVRHGDQPYRVFNEPEAVQDLWKFIEQEADATKSDAILVFDGGDHLEWNPNHYAVFQQQSKNPKPGFELLHTSLDDFLTEMTSQVHTISESVDGELREPGRFPVEVDQSWLIPGVLSSRVWIKQENAECESLLCQWAEPLSAFMAGALKEEHPSRYLEIAWKWLLQNHPHDSICGSSIDQVHEDMKYRFSQCRQIGERLRLEAGQKIAASIEGKIKSDEMRLVVFNPLARPLKGHYDLVLHIPEDWPQFNEFFGFEPKPGFRILDAGTGQELPYQRLRQNMARTKFRFFPYHFPQPHKTNDVTICLPLEIPAMGYTHLIVKRSQDKVPTRHPYESGLVTSDCSMENNLIRVQIRENGSLTLTDKRNGQVYDRLLTFEDTADIGDGWFHGMAVNDQTFSSCAGKSQVACVHDGPFQATLRIRTTMELPKSFQFDAMTRSEEWTAFTLDTSITLRKESDVLEMQTTVENHVDDHRLRVLFPTGCAGQSYLCDTPFDVVERAIAMRPDRHEFRELEVETRPQQTWTAMHDEKRGLAVISGGLLESTVRDLPERPIALTLFRATRRTVFTDGELLGQLQARLSFHFWIKPVHGAPDRRQLCELGLLLSAGITHTQLHECDRLQYQTGRLLPDQAGAFCVEGEVVMTSMSRVGAFIEMRLFNPLEHTVMAGINTLDRPAVWPRPSRIQYVDLESTPLTQPQALSEGKISIPVPAKKIITLRFLD
jgi:alpha-mannosidase